MRPSCKGGKIKNKRSHHCGGRMGPGHKVRERLSHATFHMFWLLNHMKVAQSYLTLGDPMNCPWNSLGQNTGVGSLSLLQGIFPSQGSNWGLLHCRRILYQLSHKGSPRILEWVAYPLSRGSSQPRNQTRVSCIAGGFFTNWAIRQITWSDYLFKKLKWTLKGTK